MTEIIVERHFDTPLSFDDIKDILKFSSGCFDDWQITWQDSYQSADGKIMFCRFSAPDVESVRMALRQTGTECSAKIYPITQHISENDLDINVIVKRELAAPTAFEKLQDQEESNISCLDMHNVTFIKTYFSLDQKYMLCMYNAPDVESVRISQRQAEMPVSKVYSCKELLPRLFSPN